MEEKVVGDPRLAQCSSSEGSDPISSALLTDWDDLPTAHVYSQYIWHCDAKIIANRAGLEAIAAAISAALAEGSSTVELFARDGEGYGLTIERTNSAGMDYTRLPYIADFAKCDEADYAAELRARIAELEAAPSPPPPTEPQGVDVGEQQTDNGLSKEELPDCTHPTCSLKQGQCVSAGGRTERFEDCPAGLSKEGRDG